MLHINDLTYRIAGRMLFEKATVALNANHKAGFVGRNGAGKSTLIKLILGELHADEGSISVRPRARIACVAQEAPDGSVSLINCVLATDTERAALLEEAETATDPGRIADIHERLTDIDAYTAPTRAAAILSGLGFDEESQQRPLNSFSGGWRMRVALASTLFSNPDLLLLDEPLANLDAQLRVQMREEIRRIQKEVGIITIYVTHDQEEAMAISDQLAVFNLGRLLQVGPPAEVYYTPRSLFVADFIGKANFFKVRGLEQRGDATAVTLDDGSQLIAARAYQLGADEQQRVPAGLAALLMVRPQHLSLAPPDVTGVAGTVRRIQFLGGSVRYVVECPVATQEVIVDMPEYVPGVEEGSGAHIVINPIRSCAFHL